MKHRTHVAMLLLMLPFAACGGRVDVAELDRENDELAAGNSEEPVADEAALPTPMSSQASNVPVLDEAALPTPMSSQASNVPVAPDPISGSEPAAPEAEPLDACYPLGNITLFDPGPQGGMVLFPIPEAGCTYSSGGNDEACWARWTCCGDVYTINYDRVPWGSTSFAWPPRIGGGTATGGSEPGEPCPLFDPSVADIAADGFGYSPAWYEAVNRVYGEPDDAQLMDPLPLVCDFVASSEDPCGATIVCPEHEYYAAYTDDGNIACARDGEPFEAEPDPDIIWDTCYAHTVPADECFGPGWSQYFQIAAEPQ